MTNEKLNNGDVFRSFLVENADYDGDFELPKIKTSSLIPEKTAPFSKAISAKWTDFDCEDKIFFKVGLAHMVQRLSPKNIIVYGSAPDSIFKPYKDMGINVIALESEFSKSRKRVNS